MVYLYIWFLGLLILSKEKGFGEKISFVLNQLSIQIHTIIKKRKRCYHVPEVFELFYEG